MYKSRVQAYDNIWLLFWETPFLYIVFRKGERGSWKEKALIVRADADSSNSLEFSNLRRMELGDWVKIIRRCRIIEIRIEHRFFNYSTIFCSIFLNVRGAWRRVKKYIEFIAVWIISMMASYSRIGKSYWTERDLLEIYLSAPRFFLHLNLFRPPFFHSEFNSSELII